MARNMQIGRKSSGALGFSLLELMVVLAIITILLGMATVFYQHAMLNANEAVLKTDLRAMREAIQHYTMDKKAAPQSLDDLVTGTYHYLREIPVDPITRKKDWKVDMEDVLLSVDQSTTGISDVRSSSGAISPNTNTAYSTW
jgi:general secretion pathway protein G